MEGVTRRSFLAKGSVGTVGAIGALGLSPALVSAALAEGGSGPTDEELAALDGPVFVHVRDAAAGEVEVMVAETSVVVRDRALVAKVLRASK